MLFCFVKWLGMKNWKLEILLKIPNFFHPLPSSPGNFLLSHCFSQKAEPSHSLTQSSQGSQSRTLADSTQKICCCVSSLRNSSKHIQQYPHRNVNIKLSTKNTKQTWLRLPLVLRHAVKQKWRFLSTSLRHLIFVQSFHSLQQHFAIFFFSLTIARLIDVVDF